jgi:hypothetical protein
VKGRLQPPASQAFRDIYPASKSSKYVKIHAERYPPGYPLSHGFSNIGYLCSLVKKALPVGIPGKNNKVSKDPEYTMLLEQAEGDPNAF